MKATICKEQQRSALARARGLKLALQRLRVARRRVWALPVRIKFVDFTGSPRRRTKSGLTAKRARREAGTPPWRGATVDTAHVCMNPSLPNSAIDTIAGHSKRFSIPPTSLRDAINAGRLQVGRVTESTTGIKFYQLESLDLERLHDGLVALHCRKLQGLFPGKNQVELSREVSRVLKDVAFEQANVEENIVKSLSKKSHES